MLFSFGMRHRTNKPSVLEQQKLIEIRKMLYPSIYPSFPLFHPCTDQKPGTHSFMRSTRLPSVCPRILLFFTQGSFFSHLSQ